MEGKQGEGRGGKYVDGKEIRGEDQGVTLGTV